MSQAENHSTLGPSKQLNIKNSSSQSVLQDKASSPPQYSDVSGPTPNMQDHNPQSQAAIFVLTTFLDVLMCPQV